MTPPAPRNPATTALLPILAAVVLFAVAGGLFAASLWQPDPSGRVPSQIAGLRLMRTLTGPEALADLKQMHGADFALTGGYVAYYEKKGTVWVGDTATEEQARSLIAAMVQKISAGNRVFTNLKTQQLSGREVHTVQGLGQQHYFYHLKTATIWIAVPPGAEDPFLKDALSQIK